MICEPANKRWIQPSWIEKVFAKISPEMIFKVLLPGKSLLNHNHNQMIGGKTLFTVKWLTYCQEDNPDSLYSGWGFFTVFIYH